MRLPYVHHATSFRQCPDQGSLDHTVAKPIRLRQDGCLGTLGGWATLATILAVWPANWQVALDGGMKEQQPPFDSGEAWQRHTLVTAAGSWAELRHDTLLYVKQPLVMAEGGHEAELPASKVKPSEAV